MRETFLSCRGSEERKRAASGLFRAKQDGNECSPKKNSRKKEEKEKKNKRETERQRERHSEEELVPWARVVWLSNESADETRIRDAAKMFSRNKEVSYRALSPFLSLKCQSFKCCFDVAASKSGRPEGGGYSPPPYLSLSLRVRLLTRFGN